MTGPRFAAAVKRALAAACIAWCGLAVHPACQEPAEIRDDAALRAMIERADAPGAPAIVVLDRTTVRVEATGLGHIDRRFVVKALTDAGALRWTSLRFDYDPQSNMVEIKSVRVLRKGGAVETIPLDKTRDLPQPQNAIYWGPRMKLVSVPRLMPGDALEYRVYTKGFMIAYLGGDTDDERFIPPMRGHYYDIVAFGGSTPTVLKHYSVETVRQVPLQYEVYNGPVHSKVSVTEKANRYAFWGRDLPAHRAEPDAPRVNDVLPKVVMASVPNWREKSKWFFTVNEPQFASTPEIDAKVSEILEGKESDRDRIAAIVHWCANEIRYSGITMGKGEGYTIHSSAMTFRDRCGVCKDKAGLAVTMLRVAGYDAFAAMTMAGERVESIPADQFNHCVLAVRMNDKVNVRATAANGMFTEGGRYWLLDPTWVVFSPELWSSAETEQHVVIGTGDGEALERTEARPASHNRLVMRGTSTLKPDGLIEGKLTVSGTNYADQRLRRYLVHAPAAETRARIAAWVTAMSPEGEIVALTDDYAALRNVTEPVRIEVGYKLPRYWLAGEKSIRFSVPSSHHPVRDRAIVPYWGRASLAARSQPLFVWNTRETVIEERIAIPVGYKVKTLPAAISMDHPAASLQASWRQEGDGVVFRAVIRSRMRTVPAADYAGFKAVVDAVEALGTHDVVLVK